MAARKSGSFSKASAMRRMALSTKLMIMAPSRFWKGTLAGKVPTTTIWHRDFGGFKGGGACFFGMRGTGSVVDSGWFCRRGRRSAGIGVLPVESCDFRPRPYPCGQAVAGDFDGGAATSDARVVPLGRRARRLGRRARLAARFGIVAMRGTRSIRFGRLSGGGCSGLRRGDKDMINRDALRTNPVTAVPAGRSYGRGVGTGCSRRGSRRRTVRSRAVCLRRGPQYPSRWGRDRRFRIRRHVADHPAWARRFPIRLVQAATYAARPLSCPV